jgi:GAF domain
MGRTLIEGKAMQVPDVLADPEYMYLDHQKKTGVRTLLGVPLLREGSPIGVVLLGSAGDTRTLAVHGLRIATHCREAYSPACPATAHRIKLDNAVEASQAAREPSNRCARRTAAAPARWAKRPPGRKIISHTRRDGPATSVVGRLTARAGRADDAAHPRTLGR